MYQDLWIASDGITVVRFPDLQSAEIYCAETGWPLSDLLKVRQQVIVSEDGAITVEPWRNRMDPNVDTEVTGRWSEDTYIPPLNSMVGGTTEDDEVVTINSEHLKMLGTLSYRLGWGFRDLAAREPIIYNQVLTYVKECDAQNKKPILREVENITGVYAN